MLHLYDTDSEPLVKLENIQLDYWTLTDPDEEQALIAWDVKNRRWVPSPQSPITWFDLQATVNLWLAGRYDRVRAVFVSEQWDYKVEVEAARFDFERYDDGPTPASLVIKADGVAVATMATGTGSWELTEPPKGRWFDRVDFVEVGSLPFSAVHFDAEARVRPSALAERAR